MVDPLGNRGSFRLTLVHMVVPAVIATAGAIALDKGSDAAETGAAAPIRIATAEDIAWTTARDAAGEPAAACVVEGRASLTETGAPGPRVHLLVGEAPTEARSGDCAPGEIAFADHGATKARSKPIERIQ